MWRFISSIILGILAIAIYYRNTITSQFTTIQMSGRTEAAFPGLPVVPPEYLSLIKPSTSSTARGIRQSFLAVSQSEGVGARVRRSIGTPKLKNLSPFLMVSVPLCPIKLIWKMVDCVVVCRELLWLPVSWHRPCSHKQTELTIRIARSFLYKSRSRLSWPSSSGTRDYHVSNPKSGPGPSSIPFFNATLC